MWRTIITGFLFETLLKPTIIGDFFIRKVYTKKFGVPNQEAYDLHENGNPTREGQGIFSPDLYSR